jgi:hypothetical protein
LPDIQIEAPLDFERILADAVEQAAPLRTWSPYQIQKARANDRGL